MHVCTYGSEGKQTRNCHEDACDTRSANKPLLKAMSGLAILPSKDSQPQEQAIDAKTVVQFVITLGDRIRLCQTAVTHFAFSRIGIGIRC